MRETGGKSIVGRRVAMAALALLLTAVCVPQVFAQGAPAMPVLPGQAAPNLMATVPSTAQGVVIIRDARGFDQKLAQTANKIMPGAFQAQEGQPVRGPLMQGLAEVEPMMADGSPLIMLMMITEEVGQPPVTALMFQPRAGTAAAELGDQVTEIEQGEMFGVRYRNFVLVSPSQNVAQLAQGEAGMQLQEMQQLRMNQADVFAFGNLAEMIKRSEPTYQMQRQQIQEQIRQMEGAGDEDQVPLMKIQLETMERFWGFAKQTDWFSGVLVLGEQAADTEMILSFLEESPAGKYLSQHQPIGDKLTPGLPDVPTWGAFWYSVDRQRTLGLVRDFMQQINQMIQRQVQNMPADSPQRAAVQQSQQQIQQTIELLQMLDWVEFRGATAMTFTPEGQQGLRALQAVRLADAENWRPKLQQYIERAQRMTQPKDGTPGIRLVYEPEARKVDSMVLDRYIQELIVPEQQPQSPQDQMAMKLMQKIFGPDKRMVSWITESKGWMLSQTAPEPDQIQAMAAALEGNGLAQTEKFAALQQYLVPQANFVGYFSLATMSKMINAAVMEAEGMAVEGPTPADAKDFTVISESWREGRAHARIVMPISEMQSLTANLAPLFMMGRQDQPAARPNNEAQPGGGDEF